MFRNDNDHDNFIKTCFDGQTPIDQKYHYYFIPKWTIGVAGIDIDENKTLATLKTQMDTYTSRVFDKGSILMVYFKDIDASVNYFGYGFYTNIKSQHPYRFSENIIKSLYCDREYENSTDKFLDKLLWFGPGNTENQTYPCSIIKDESDTHNMFVKLNNNDIYRKAIRLSDSQSCVSFRNFCPDDANTNWNYGEKNVRYLYEYNIPVITENKKIYAAAIVNKLYEHVSDIMSNNITLRWKIYKRIGLTDRKMIMECYNKALALELVDKGMYDIDVDIFDIYGNKYTKEMGSAITYK
jgi:hypothetical protein